jgi:NAD(P)-dependent dehydrogenase (short-subunit alcohol dehydrogenase family)
MKQTISAYGKLDGAFNNAGIAPSHKSFHEISATEWQRVVDVDLSGAFLCMKHEIAAMLETGGGSIVNTASALGVVAVPSAADYIAAKHGVIGLTKAAAVDYGCRNIRVNAVLPGLIMTPLVKEALRDPAYASHFEKYKAHIWWAALDCRKKLRRQQSGFCRMQLRSSRAIRWELMAVGRLFNTYGKAAACWCSSMRPFSYIEVPAHPLAGKFHFSPPWH